jgi:hypothetical protein
MIPMENPPMRSLLDLVLEEGEKRGLERAKEAVQQGMQQGMQQGLVVGLRTMLQAQLTARFGPLPDATAARVAAGSGEDLQRWGRDLLAAATLDEVFAPRA